jgi:hypothetical protein
MYSNICSIKPHVTATAEFCKSDGVIEELGSSDSIVFHYRLDGRSSILGRGEGFFL